MRTSVFVGEPRCLVDARNLCGEGAVWHPEEQALYWADINGFTVSRWRQEDGDVRIWRFDEPVTALALTSDPDRLLLVMASGASFWNAETHRLRAAGFVLPEWPMARCNDARVDPSGALWIATMQNNVAADGRPLPIHTALGKLYRFDRFGHTSIWRTELGIGNTIAWSPDRRFLFSGDTLEDQIDRYRIEPDGTLRDPGLWCARAGPGLPDGSAMDADGHLWNCRHGGGCLLRIDPEGNVQQTVAMPVLNPTTCIFGGPALSTLFVTSAALGDPLHAQAGGLFALETGVTGLPPNRFGASTRGVG